MNSINSLIQWVYKGYIYNPLFTSEGVLFSHEVFNMSSPDEVAFVYDGKINDLMKENEFIDFVDYMMRASRSGM